MFIRRLDKPIEDNFRKSSLWLSKIKQDCKKQNVFLAIRDNRVDLYHKGAAFLAMMEATLKLI